MSNKIFIVIFAILLANINSFAQENELRQIVADFSKELPKKNDTGIIKSVNYEEKMVSIVQLLQGNELNIGYIKSLFDSDEKRLTRMAILMKNGLATFIEYVSTADAGLILEYITQGGDTLKVQYTADELRKCATIEVEQPKLSGRELLNSKLTASKQEIGKRVGVGQTLKDVEFKNNKIVSKILCDNDRILKAIKSEFKKTESRRAEAVRLCMQFGDILPFIIENRISYVWIFLSKTSNKTAEIELTYKEISEVSDSPF